jgi:hypothetical protein
VYGLPVVGDDAKLAYYSSHGSITVRRDEPYTRYSPIEMALVVIHRGGVAMQMITSALLW